VLLREEFLKEKMKKADEIKLWVEDAIKKGYTNEEVIELLQENHYEPKDIEEILAIFNSFKSNWEAMDEDEKTEKKLKEKAERFQKELSFMRGSINEDNKYREEIEKKEKENRNKGKKEWGMKKDDLRRAERDRLAYEIKEISSVILKVKKEVAKVVIGQEEVIDAFICALLCGGHVLLEGVPGIAKTLIVKSLAEASGCSSNRIQFTVDLLPSDIIGITTYTPERGFEIIKGPIFANFIVADEINRSPPKTQSALIEAMQEKQVTIGKETFKLSPPFFVMANNNPLEASGVYDLPEAQIDRFLFKLFIGYPEKNEEKNIMANNVTLNKFEDFGIKAILSPERILYMQGITKRIYVDDRIKEYIVRLVDKTRKKDFEHAKYIDWGGSPRASIGLYIASKAWALIHGRDYVVPSDVKAVAHFVLRHRIILNYKATAEKITSDMIIDEILNMIKV
jgi:MoxR-like ATPase